MVIVAYDRKIGKTHISLSLLAGGFKHVFLNVWDSWLSI